MDEKFWQIMLAGMMLFAALFILSVFDIAIFDGQCVERCGNCYSNINIFALDTGCGVENVTYFCSRECERRGLSCDFNPVYKQRCENCTNECDRKYPVGSAGFGNCTTTCSFG